MEKSNLYLLNLSVLLLATVVSLISLNETLISVYAGFFAVEYFACALIYRPSGQAYLLISATIFVLWAITAVLTVAGIGI